MSGWILDLWYWRQDAGLQSESLGLDVTFWTEMFGILGIRLSVWTGEGFLAQNRCKLTHVALSWTAQAQKMVKGFSQDSVFTVDVAQFLHSDWI